MAIVTCAQMCCTNEFVRHDGRTGTPRLYCDDHRRVKGVTPKLTMKCPVCGETFDGVATRKFCSLDCRNERQRIEREKRRVAARAATEKHCKWCEQMLPLTEFRKDAKRLDGLYPYCRDCWREYTNTKKQEPSKWASKSEYNRNYRAVNRARIKNAYTDRYLWTTYRLTPHGFNEMLKRQGGRCAICQTDKPGRKGFNVDHDHSCCTGSRSCGDCVRGLLCFPCNVGIGFLRDNPATLRSALRYLAAPPNQQTQPSDDDEWTLKLA